MSRAYTAVHSPDERQRRAFRLRCARDTINGSGGKGKDEGPVIGGQQNGIITGFDQKPNLKVFATSLY